MCARPGHSLKLIPQVSLPTSRWCLRQAPADKRQIVLPQAPYIPGASLVWVDSLSFSFLFPHLLASICPAPYLVSGPFQVLPGSFRLLWAWQLVLCPSCLMAHVGLGDAVWFATSREDLRLFSNPKHCQTVGVPSTIAGQLGICCSEWESFP